jgi:hypothetical protein
VGWRVPFQRLARLGERAPVRVGVALIVVTAAVVVTLLIGLVRMEVRAPAPLVVPAQWQPYRDPVGFFTAQVPVGWRITDGPTAPWTPSLAKAVRSQYLIYLTDPVGGIDDWGLVVQVLPFRYDQYGHEMACEWRSGWNTQGAGLSAQFTPDGASFANDVALYLVNYWFKWQSYWDVQKSVGPVPANAIPVAQQVLQRFVSTLRPLPLKALSC